MTAFSFSDMTRPGREAGARSVFLDVLSVDEAPQAAASVPRRMPVTDSKAVMSRPLEGPSGE
jgi:hypothetical protein